MTTAVQRAFENEREALAEISEHYELKIGNLRKELAEAKEEIEKLKDSIFSGKSTVLSRIRTENITIAETGFLSPRRQETAETVLSVQKNNEFCKSPLQARFPENKFLQFSFARPPPLFQKN